MNITVIGGTGFIGQPLVKHFLQQHHKITVVGRSVKKIKKIFPEKVSTIALDELNISNFQNCDLVINLAGANIGEKSWKDKYKKEILSSRVDLTKNLVDLLLKLETPPELFNASAVGVYDLQKTKTDNYFDENTPIDFNAKPNFLTDVARDWEKATWPLKERDARVVNMRFGVVIDKSGGVYKKLALPFYFGFGGKVGSGLQAFSWIALADLIRAIDFLIERKNLSGPINFVSPNCITQLALAKAIAKELHRPCFMTTPAWLLKIVFGQMAEELLLQGQHVKPAALAKTGFRFEYADIVAALRQP